MYPGMLMAFELLAGQSEQIHIHSGAVDPALSFTSGHHLVKPVRPHQPSFTRFNLLMPAYVMRQPKPPTANHLPPHHSAIQTNAEPV